MRIIVVETFVMWSCEHEFHWNALSDVFRKSIALATQKFPVLLVVLRNTRQHRIELRAMQQAPRHRNMLSG